MKKITLFLTLSLAISPLLADNASQENTETKKKVLIGAGIVSSLAIVAAVPTAIFYGLKAHRKQKFINDLGALWDEEDENIDQESFNSYVMKTRISAIAAVIAVAGLIASGAIYKKIKDTQSKKLKA